MKMETKYDLHQKVWTISRTPFYYFSICPTCKGQGDVEIAQSKRIITCPDCNGNGGWQTFDKEKWSVGLKSEIGRVSFEQTYHKNALPKIIYMLRATGVGTGQLWDEDRLYPTKELAEEECRKRNG